MENVKVKDLMVPLTDYATVSPTASLREAVIALSEIQDKPFGKFPHRAVLVMTEDGDVIGKISQWDVIRSLEPKYSEIGEFDKLSSFGFSLDFIKNIQDTYNLWQQPSESLSDHTKNICVKDIMYTPAEGEFVSEDQSIRVAIHQMTVGQHHSLLVLRNKQVTGILRFVDVFNEIAKLICM
jgi:CBS domain-containing protein